MSFKRLDPEDFLVSADAVQSTAWSTGNQVLDSFSTSSAQVAGTSGNYYMTVYDSNGQLASSSPQFDIAYGNKEGKGSTPFNSSYPEKSPSSVIYGQYRSMVLEDENAVFITGQGATGITQPCSTTTSNTIVEMDHFYVLSIDRARYKQNLFPGTFNLILGNANGDTLQLTDNSNDTSVQSFLGSTRAFQIVEGENGSGIAGGGYTADKGSYGLFLPDMGTILLNPDAIALTIPEAAANINSNISNDINYNKIFNAMAHGASFSLNSEETITSDYIFIRARNSEFNYSENPSFISGSTGELIHDSFINNPQVFMTTVGMYNDSNELMAVAKLSRPLIKDFTKESLLRVKLDF
tara:strand:- start:2819 stop:3874 length:1056 start_codon:yes stop_codon:yes gene_type:complete